VATVSTRDGMLQSGDDGESACTGLVAAEQKDGTDGMGLLLDGICMGEP